MSVFHAQESKESADAESRNHKVQLDVPAERKLSKCSSIGSEHDDD